MLLHFLGILFLYHGAVAKEVPADQLTMITNELERMETEMKQLQNNIQQLTVDKKNLKMENQKLKQQLQTHHQTHQSEIDQLKTSNQNCQSFERRLMSEVENLKITMDKQNRAMQYMRENLEGINLDQPDDINDVLAFSAYVTHGPVIYEAGERIMFEGLEYNSANFSNVTSEFTCPTTGLYYFNVNLYIVMVGTPDSARVEVVMGGSRLMEIYTNSDYTGSDAHSGIVSNSIITVCTVGDTVYLQAVRVSEVYGFEDQRRLTFNGLLMAE